MADSAQTKMQLLVHERAWQGILITLTMTQKDPSSENRSKAGRWRPGVRSEIKMAWVGPISPGLPPPQSWRKTHTVAYTYNYRIKELSLW